MANDDYVEGDGDDEVYAQFLAGDLPLSPEDLLTPEQHAALREDCARMARLRREAEASTRDWIMP